MNELVRIVVPWVRVEQRDLFCKEWNISTSDPRIVFQRDVDREGSGATKNKGIARAIEQGASVVIILDDDCFPYDGQSIEQFIDAHVAALQPQPVEMFEAVTDPPSRGTPYFRAAIEMPVAASMGFWTEIGDHCAVRQLALDSAPMTFHRRAVYQRYFPLCGMNLAFRPAGWEPWWQFIEVPRFDDIWMGWLWQREAYWRGHCFNLAGPLVRHSRQSNVWANLREEAVHLEANETLWRKIAMHPIGNYDALTGLLPCPVRQRKPSPE